jgi:hypothetical protein
MDIKKNKDYNENLPAEKLSGGLWPLIIENRTTWSPRSVKSVECGLYRLHSRGMPCIFVHDSIFDMVVTK